MAITKQSLFSGVNDQGPLVHIVHPGYNNDQLIKQASASAPQLEVIRNFLKNHERKPGVLYTLVCALGAGEFWSSNSNADWFGMDALLHVPPDWAKYDYIQQRNMGKTWEWGYPTFYNAHSFVHHQNKDPGRAIGNVELVLWDSRMKRVLLVVSVDRALANKFGGGGVVDRIENGEFPDVSMGCRVPFDVCSRCGDMDRIMANIGNPRKILEDHKRSAIRGLSTETNLYCQHLKFELNRIYPDGVKVMMLNLHPRFFDISFVFIGADKTAKMLAKLASGLCPIRETAPICKKGCSFCHTDDKLIVVPSHHIYSIWSREDSMDKTASVSEAEIMKEAFGSWDENTDPKVEKEVSNYFKKGRLVKRSEIDKRVISNFGTNALPKLEASEEELPRSLLDEMSTDIPGSLGSAGALGIVLKPREFQRIILRGMGADSVADDLYDRNMTFPAGGTPEDFPISGIVPKLIESLMPLTKGRSAFGPMLNRRVISINITIRPQESNPGAWDGGYERTGLMDKLSSLYGGYRRNLIYNLVPLVKQATDRYPQILESMFEGDLVRSFGGGLPKIASDVFESVIGGPITVTYLNEAYLKGPASEYLRESPDLGGLIEVGELSAMAGQRRAI
jgi:hypothetical protein